MKWFNMMGTPIVGGGKANSGSTIAHVAHVSSRVIHFMKTTVTHQNFPLSHKGVICADGIDVHTILLDR
jgi:hypothetical protein